MAREHRLRGLSSFFVRSHPPPSSVFVQRNSPIQHESDCGRGRLLDRWAGPEWQSSDGSMLRMRSVPSSRRSREEHDLASAKWHSSPLLSAQEMVSHVASNRDAPLCSCSPCRDHDHTRMHSMCSPTRLLSYHFSSGRPMSLIGGSACSVRGFALLLAAPCTASTPKWANYRFTTLHVSF